MRNEEKQDIEQTNTESVVNSDSSTDEVIVDKPKRKVKVSTIVTTSIVVTTAIAAGLATGIIFGKLMSTGDVELPPIEEGVEMDYDALLERYAEDNDPNHYKPHELANISWNLYAKKENTYSWGRGKAHAAIVDQYTYSYDLRRGDLFYGESVSSNKGMKVKQVAVKYYMNSENVKTYRGSGAELGPVRANWNENSEIVETFEEYENKWGKLLGRPCIFIISPRTVLTETLTRDADNNFVIEMDMDLVNSVHRYMRQMISMSGLTSAPTFHKMHLKFILDENLNLKYLRSEESYTVYVVGKNDSEGFFETFFYHEATQDIPPIQSTFNYEEI